MRSLLGRFHRPMSRGAMGDMLTMNSLGDGSTLSLDFTTMGGVLDPRLTFSRASTATFVNSSGYVDHAGANLLLYSAYADTNWIAYGTYVKAYTTGITSPIGDTTAARITFDAVGKGLYYNSASLGSPNVVGATYTMSAWIRATGSTTNPAIRFGDSGVAIGSNIPITTTWTRYSLTYTNAVSSSSPSIQSASGTATGEFEMWGFQLNPGSTAQTYYPTTTAAYYAPRFDYSPTNIGEPRGLLIEGQTTNVALNSNAIGNAGGLTRTYPTGVISPDGTENAQRFTKTDATTPRYIYPTTSFTVAASTAYTASIWIKYDGYAFTTQIQSDSAIDWGGSWTAAFVIASGGITVGSRTGICSASTVTAYPNGWYRCTATITTGAAPTGSNPRFLIDVVGTTGVTVLVYGLQLELGSGASSYIPTGASGVTRNADNCVMTGTNFSSWYTQGIGTVSWSGSVFRTTAGHLANINTVNNDPRITAYVGAGSLTNLVTNGTTQASFFFGTVTANTAFKAAWRFNTNDFAACLNAGTVYTDTLGSVPTGVDRMQLGAAEGGYQFLDGWIKSFKYYPTAFTNAQLQAITTL